MTSVKDWNPNTDLVPNVWGVYAGVFVTYKNRGPALNAFMREYGAAALWELEDGEWMCRAYKPKKRMNFRESACDVCADRPMAAIGDGSYATGYWAWKREGGKITSPPELLFVCYSCLQAIS